MRREQGAEAGAGVLGTVVMSWGCAVGALQELRVVSSWWGRDLVCLTPVSPGPALRVARGMCGKYAGATRLPKADPVGLGQR